MDYAVLSGPRVVVLDQDVDDDVANDIAAQLLRLAGEDPQADILLRIDSPGGSVSSGMAIYDVMHFVQCDVATCAVGLVAGIAQFLLSAGAPGKRCAVQDARIAMSAPMPAQREESEGARDYAKLQRAGWKLGHPPEGTELHRTRQKIYGLAAKHIGRDPAQIRIDSERKREFSADEARAYGLVDRVLDQTAGL